MSFEDDSFEDIVNQFFGNSGRIRKSRIKRFVEDEDQNSQFIEEDNYLYLIVELPGYSEKEISVSIKEDRILISAKSSRRIEAQDYLEQKRREGIMIEQILPDNIKTKNFTKTFRNGVLEVTFEKR